MSIFKIKYFTKLYVALLLILAMISIGISGYILIEKYTFLEAFYMTIITIATVGFQEVHPLSDVGKIFTAFLIITSFGTFAYAISAITKYVVEGANLVRNEYGSKLFANFFFFITGFHGFHVFTGVLINIIIFFNVLLGTYEKRKSYEMVEKVGLYWHFVDLVWVFVFTFFYLV